MLILRSLFFSLYHFRTAKNKCGARFPDGKAARNPMDFHAAISAFFKHQFSCSTVTIVVTRPDSSMLPVSDTFAAIDVTMPSASVCSFVKTAS